MKIGNMRRALVFASVFNLLVAIYFIIISSISLVQLRWYHQLTITLRVRNVVTSATSYFAFLILIFVALVFIIIFVLNTIKLKPKSYVSTDQDAFSVSPQPGSSGSGGHQTRTKSSAQRRSDSRNNGGLVIRESASLTNATNSNICCSTLLHLVASASLIIIIVIWLLNSGELVRDSISSQLDLAFAKYQFANRSNHYSIAIDGMQDINNCCGSLDYTDFPHQRTSGLSSGHYPGSCCGKNIFGVNARVICQPEEIVRAKQTAGCVTVIANYYDLISLLVVPIALASLSLNIIIIALMSISRGRQLSVQEDSKQSRALRERPTVAGELELKG